MVMDLFQNEGDKGDMTISCRSDLKSDLALEREKWCEGHSWIN